MLRAIVGKQRFAVVAGATWADPAALERLAFTSAHRRIARPLG